TSRRYPRDTTSVFHPSGAPRSHRGVPRTARRRMARHAPGPVRDRMGQLLAVPGTRRAPRRVSRDRGLRSRQGRDGRTGRQRPLAGRDGPLLRGHRRRRRRRVVQRAHGGLPPGGPTGGGTGPATEGSLNMSDRATHAKTVLASQNIETPSWAFGNSGTRFKVFAQEGVPRDPYEKIADAAQVHRHTGAAGTVALHIPWDKVDDYARLAAHAADHGVRIGTINSNTFQDTDFMLGSVCHPDPGIRRKATDHLLECVDIMDAVGS